MIDGLWGNTSPCQEGLGADYVDVAANVASLWLSASSLQCRQETATAWWKQYCQAVRYTTGSSFLSFCQQTLDKSCTLAEPCGIISPLCVTWAFTSSWYSVSSVQTETLLLAHTCGFHTEVEKCLRIIVLTQKRWGLIPQITSLTHPFVFFFLFNLWKNCIPIQFIFLWNLLWTPEMTNT